MYIILFISAIFLKCVHSYYQKIAKYKQISSKCNLLLITSTYTAILYLYLDLYIINPLLLTAASLAFFIPLLLNFLTSWHLMYLLCVFLLPICFPLFSPAWYNSKVEKLNYRILESKTFFFFPSFLPFLLMHAHTHTRVRTHTQTVEIIYKR